MGTFSTFRNQLDEQAVIPDQTIHLIRDSRSATATTE